MKKFTLLFVLVVAVLVPTMIHAQGIVAYPAVITPYIDGPDFTVYEDQPVIIRVRWGACKAGLALLFTHVGSVALDISQGGESVAALDPPSTEYWTRRPQILQDPPLDPAEYCVLPSKDIWQVEWLYPLGVLAPGTYDGHLVLSTTQWIYDGGEGTTYDGRMEFWPPGYVFQDVDFTITVE